MWKPIPNLWPRLKGQGWEVAKFHKQLHVLDDIVRFGSPQGTHSGPMEHNHICHVKQPAKTTPRCFLSLDEQLGNCVMEQHIINLAFQLMNNTCNPPSDSLGIIQSTSHFKFHPILLPKHTIFQ